MERDNDRAQIFDQADDRDRQQQDTLYRERELTDALDECARAGLSKETLRVLARETGACVWAMKNSLKGA